MPPAAVLQRTWHDVGPRRFGGEAFWNTTKAYSAAEARAFEALPAPRNLNSTQAAQAGWPRVFERKLPRRLPPAAVGDAWFEWLSERCHLIIDGRLYDGKIMHIIVKPRPTFFVLVSHRDGATGPWTHELWRVPVKGTRQRPFDGTRGAAWPGPDEMQAPGHPSSDLEALFPDGSERYVADAWTRPIGELVVAVGPAPHLYFSVTATEGLKVWVEDDGGSVLVKDSDRPKLYEGYQGDETGRYSRIWLNKDRVKAVTKSSVGWTGGDLWRRRNAAVLHSHWGSFKKVESWYAGELLFNYNFGDDADVLKFNAFLLVAPSTDSWVTAPSLADFRDRCLRADQRAFSRFELPHMSGGVPAEAEEEDEEDEEGGTEDVAETDRLSLAAYPPPYVLNWGKLTGVKGKVPTPYIVHDGEPVTDVFKIDYAVPSDPFYQVANSGLLISAQLSSLYSSVGTRAHLVLSYKPLIADPAIRVLDDSEALYVQLRHVRATDKSSPYEVDDASRIILKPVFYAWVFEAFYVQFVQHVFAALAGTPRLVEYPVYHPNLLVGRSGVLRAPQTFLDAIYQLPDGSLTLVDYKTLMQARPPNYRLRDQKNLRQIVTNAAFFQAMTRIRLQRASLVYITRMGTLTVVTVELDACGAVTKSALLQPLAKATHRISYTSEKYGVNKQIKVLALDELGAFTGTDTGAAIPASLRPPVPPQALQVPAAQVPQAAPVQPPARRRSRRLNLSDEDEAIFGAMYVAGPAAAAAAVVEDAQSPPVQQTTLDVRRDINERIAEAADGVFDGLSGASKSRLRGRAQAFFDHLAASSRLFPPLETADGTVAPSPPSRLSPADPRPLLVQALIRTAQRALNQAVARQFVRTRSERARAEVAEGLSVQDFAQSVAHHARRDLWSEEAVEWAEAHLENVLTTLKAEVTWFIEQS